MDANQAEETGAPAARGLLHYLRGYAEAKPRHTRSSTSVPVSESSTDGRSVMDDSLVSHLSNNQCRYEKLSFLGEGQFAIVYLGKDKMDNSLVAMKKIKLGSRDDVRDGINRSATRELKLMRELHHPYVINLLDVFLQGYNVILVLPFMDTDLETVIRDDSIVISPAHIKRYMIMLLEGTDYLHKNFLLHRDLKPNNLLVNRNACCMRSSQRRHGVMKVTDFGLAKSFGSPSRAMTNQVVTRWYRAPELLLGATMYGHGIDMWAIGCVFAELLQRAPFFPGEADIDQLMRIFKVMGTPSAQQWPHMSLLQAVKFRDFPAIPLHTIFRAAPADALELMRGLLYYDPNQRPTADQALQMPYFQSQPYPSPLAALPLPAKVKRKIETEARTHQSPEKALSSEMQNKLTSLGETPTARKVKRKLEFPEVNAIRT